MTARLHQKDSHGAYSLLVPGREMLKAPRPPHMRTQNSAPRRLGMAKVLTAAIAPLAALLLAATPGRAQQAPAESPPPASEEHQKHVYNYDKFDLACLRWTDQCRICVRNTSGQDSVCSNIGIACQPKNIECLRRGDESNTDK